MPQTGMKQEFKRRQNKAHRCKRNKQTRRRRAEKNTDAQSDRGRKGEAVKDNGKG